MATYDAKRLRRMTPLRAVVTTSGPLATVYGCPHCRFTVRLDKGIPGIGRGYGLAGASNRRGQVVAHIRAAHGALYPR